MVDLRGFDDLQRHFVIVVFHPEGASTRFAFVLHHAADAYGAIEFVVQIINLFDVVVAVHKVRDVHHQLFLCKADGIFKFSCADSTLVKHLKILECALLQVEEKTRQHFFIYDSGLCLRLRNDVVDILDKDDFFREVVQILNECAVASWTEQNLAVGFTEQLTICIDGF